MHDGIEAVQALRGTDRGAVTLVVVGTLASTTVTEHLRRFRDAHPAIDLRLRAERQLGVHALRVADAFQLAAALLWCRGETAGNEFISFDQRLREAARREGFVVPPD